MKDIKRDRELHHGPAQLAYPGEGDLVAREAPSPWSRDDPDGCGSQLSQLSPL